MGLFKRLAGLFSGGRSGPRFVDIYVLSRRCNEPIAGRVDLFNELSLAEEEHDYYARKVLHTSGERRCFDQVEVQLWFNRNKEIVDHQVSGGRWLEADEYAAEVARFNAPPVEDDSDSEEAQSMPADADDETKR